MIINGKPKMASRQHTHATLQLAYNELAALLERRFQGTVPTELVTEFVIDPSLPSFEVTVREGKLIFAGPSEVEILYGVYDFAEKYLGYCFFEPGNDRLSGKDASVALPDGILIAARAPRLKRCGFIQEFPFSEESYQLADWMAKNKLNYLMTWMKYYDRLDEKLKEYFRVRGIEIESGHHNFDYWIPGAKYGSTNPEFFAEIGGQRISPSGDKAALLLSEQLCTTNLELRREIVKNIIEYCRKYPEIKTISLIPNDGFGWCECEKCSAFYDKNQKGEAYSVSAHVYKADKIYHDMVRDIVRQVREVLPDINVTFVAYVNYCSPSKGFKLEKNMAVHMAPYWRCINHTINDPECPINSRYASDICNWVAAKDGGEINIYEYYMGVNLYISLPMVHHRDIFTEMKWYRDHKVDGVLTQFHLSHWTVYGMNYYLMAKAARGEDENSAAHATMQKIFGADAALAEKFYDSLKDMLLDLGACHVPYPYSMLSRTSLARLEKIWQLARELSARQPADRFRRELVIWCEYMVKFKTLFDAYHAAKVGVEDVEAFRQWIHTHRDTRIFVHDKVDMLLNAWIDAIRNGTDWLHFNIGWEDGYIRQHHDTWKKLGGGNV